MLRLIAISSGFYGVHGRPSWILQNPASPPISMATSLSCLEFLQPKESCKLLKMVDLGFFNGDFKPWNLGREFDDFELESRYFPSKVYDSHKCTF